MPLSRIRDLNRPTHVIEFSTKEDKFISLAVNARDTNLAVARQILKAHTAVLN
ncbi:hypothetical protein [Hymenobacter volaticus]|uniref:Uncharacterized protein n=1 Tax=Hymenobacter volaticus TaxID=2932254 RepID=A0ABY4GEZ5_9BACT|nr:hypothetical protein [Hymenobacter volaticus]UOQ69495.1 hypothetical protein MUN86_28030 [Hymenobacter volaticus]